MQEDYNKIPDHIKKRLKTFLDDGFELMSSFDPKTAVHSIYAMKEGSKEELSVKWPIFDRHLRNSTFTGQEVDEFEEHARITGAKRFFSEEILNEGHIYNFTNPIERKVGIIRYCAKQSISFAWEWNYPHTKASLLKMIKSFPSLPSVEQDLQTLIKEYKV